MKNFKKGCVKMSNNANKYKQTKSFFSVRGQIVGLNNPKSGFGFKEDKTKTNKSYRALKFNVKNALSNVVTVEIFGTEQDKAYFHNKSIKDTIAVAWNRRHDFEQEGYNIIKPAYDLAEEVCTNFKDGDTVVVTGNIQFSEYVSRDGRKVKQTRLLAKNVHEATEPIDLENTDAETLDCNAAFSQEVIINDVIDDKDTLYVNAYTIDYGDVFNKCILEAKKGVIPDGFYNNIKKLKFGTIIKFDGIINNRAITANGGSGEWGQTPLTKTEFHKSLEIRSADPDSLVQAYYTQSEIEEAILAHSSKVNEKDKNFNPSKKSNEEELPFELG